ncbi:amidase [Xanthomonas euvesicatoria pv. citrumelo F1]|nr:amidase [Xanthomonas euvesicatoria pv. citrumelo F1]
MRSTLLSFALLAALCGCAHADDPSRSAASAADASTAHPLDLSEADVAGLQARMASGQSSSLQLTRAYLQRIAGIDRAGPRLNAVIELNPQAEADARALDAERKAGHVRGPLHGIPVLLKDNIDALPMVNSAGSLALAEFRPARDAFVVQRLRTAGAVILGKTNLSEWANFRSTQSSSGWSGRGGLTRNPYALDRNPCGSSAGTGAAIAASLATVGIGTETDGSITCPASVNGLVGLKPTVGLVSRDGIIPISASQDTAGPMTRSVADAAAVLQAIAAPDPQDPATAKAPATSVDYLAHLKPDSLRGARLGLLRNPLREDPAIAAVLDRAVRTLRDAGATVVETALATDGKWDAAEQMVLLVEFKAGLNAYLQNHHAPVANLEQLIAFNRKHAQREMPYFGQELFEQAQGAPGLDDAGYLSARQRQAIGGAGRHRRSLEGRSPGCLDRAHDGRGVDHHTRQGRYLPRRRLWCRGGGRLSKPERTDGTDQGLATGPVVHGHGLERAAPDRAGVCIRATQPCALYAWLCAECAGCARWGHVRHDTRRACARFAPA